MSLEFKKNKKEKGHFGNMPKKLCQKPEIPLLAASAIDNCLKSVQVRESYRWDFSRKY